MKKTLTASLMASIGFQKTDEFFMEFQKAREALKRLSSSEIHELDGDFESRRTYFEQRDFARYELNHFNSHKEGITPIGKEGRLCYVPSELREYLKTIQETEKFYSQFYWDKKQNCRVYV